jgi:hypothetical protein
MPAAAPLLAEWLFTGCVVCGIGFVVPDAAPGAGLRPYTVVEQSEAADEHCGKTVSEIRTAHDEGPSLGFSEKTPRISLIIFRR